MQTELSLSTVTATQEQVDTLLRELLPARSATATSVVLEGFSISVDAVFDAE